MNIMKLFGNGLSKFKTAVVLPDMHVPFQDNKAIKLALKVVSYLKLDRIIQLGDFQDFYSISRFDKDPNRIDSMQEELDTGFEIWKKIKKAGKKAKLEYTEGNHEFRLRRYLWRHPELHSLKALKLENVLRVKELGIKFYRTDDICYINRNLIVTHGAKDDGCKLAQYSGYSAKNTLERIGIPGISGHSHRLAAHYKTDFNDTKEWYEAGCLCQLNPEYVKKPNWQQGFVVVRYTDRLFDVKLVHIKKGYWCVVDGRKFNLK